MPRLLPIVISAASHSAFLSKVETWAKYAGHEYVSPRFLATGKVSAVKSCFAELGKVGLTYKDHVVFVYSGLGCTIVNAAGQRDQVLLLSEGPQPEFLTADDIVACLRSLGGPGKATVTFICDCRFEDAPYDEYPVFPTDIQQTHPAITILNHVPSKLSMGDFLRGSLGVASDITNPTRLFPACPLSRPFLDILGEGLARCSEMVQLCSTEDQRQVCLNLATNANLAPPELVNCCHEMVHRVFGDHQGNSLSYLPVSGPVTINDVRYVQIASGSFHGMVPGTYAVIDSHHYCRVATVMVPADGVDVYLTESGERKESPLRSIGHVTHLFTTNLTLLTMGQCYAYLLIPDLSATELPAVLVECPQPGTAHCVKTLLRGFRRDLRVIEEPLATEYYRLTVDSLGVSALQSSVDPSQGFKQFELHQRGASLYSLLVENVRDFLCFRRLKEYRVPFLHTPIETVEMTFGVYDSIRDKNPNVDYLPDNFTLAYEADKVPVLFGPVGPKEDCQIQWNIRNNGPAPVHVVVLWISHCGNVNIVYPYHAEHHGVSHEIRPKRDLAKDADLWYKAIVNKHYEDFPSTIVKYGGETYVKEELVLVTSAVPFNVMEVFTPDLSWEERPRSKCNLVVNPVFGGEVTIQRLPLLIYASEANNTIPKSIPQSAL